MSLTASDRNRTMVVRRQSKSSMAKYLNEILFTFVKVSDKDTFRQVIKEQKHINTE